MVLKNVARMLTTDRQVFNWDNLARSMAEDSISIDHEQNPKERNYIEIVVRQFKPIIFGVLSCLCLILAALEIVAGIFFIFSLTFFMLTIIMIVTSNNGNRRRLKLDKS